VLTSLLTVYNHLLKLSGYFTDIVFLSSLPQFCLFASTFGCYLQGVELRDTGTLLVEFKAAEDENDALAGESMYI
jgi:hypothetical protein